MFGPLKNIKQVMSINIRPATSRDLPTLSVIATAAKASWGYDKTLLNQWRDELALTRTQLDEWTVKVATDGESIVGFFAVAPGDGIAELVHLWVSPEVMGLCWRRSDRGNQDNHSGVTFV